MSRRTPAHAVALCSCALLLSLVAHAPAASAQAVVTGVSSRLIHGQVSGQGGQTFDLPLPQTAPYGIEPRLVSGGMALVVTFDRQLTGAGATVVGGGAAVAATNGVVVAGNTVTVNLTGVANQVQINVRLTNITDQGGGTVPARDLFFRTLLGDCNGSGSVTVGDVNYFKLFNPTSTGQLTYGSYRADLNLTGNVTTGDVNLIKAEVGKSVAGGPQANTSPTVTNLTDQSTPAGAAMASVPFTIADFESPSANLHVTATSGNLTLVPAANIVLGGAGAQRTIAITPAANQVGTATITVSVTDGIATTTDTFLLTVGNAQKLYVATLKPTDAGTITTGSGTATLLVSGDQSQAVFRVSYSNLTTNKTASHIHLGGLGVNNGPIIFDVDQPPDGSLQPDGSYVWVFTPSGNGSITVAQIQQAIADGETYFNVHTTKYPDGELRGQFQFASGSQTFSKPPPAPAIDGADMNLSTDPVATRNAVRFLTQASFGATQGDGTGVTDIERLKTLGSYNAWIEEQFNKPTTSMLQLIARRIKEPTPTFNVEAANVRQSWWAIALGGTDYTNAGARLGDDQLRQRVAFALSQLFVVSQQEESIGGEPLGVASYHDMLANNAFGSFRTLLKDVTLHPVMGQYLNMRGNRKKTSATAPDPNENYAREVLQLFSIGLNAMHPDGTLRLDASGLPIPTYDQATIQNFARVFTGWDLNSTRDPFDYWNENATPPALVTSTATTGISTRYIRPMVANQSNHDVGTKVLLDGSPVNKTIAANLAAGAELDLALDNIFHHPNVGPFVARRLIQRLVTSVPSPAYVWRVARVFDGYRGYDETTPSAPRGDLKETVRAVLLDYEARSATQIGNSGFGKLKEPVIRIAQVARAFRPYSGSGATGFWALPGTTTDFGQTPYNSPTVFNFFEPDYSVVQKLVKANGAEYTVPLNVPEAQILTENTSIYMVNMLHRTFLDYNATSFQNANGNNSDVRIDMTFEGTLAPAAANMPALLDHLDNVLMAGQMPTGPGSMRERIHNYITTTPGSTSVNTALERARVAAFLIVASPLFGVQK